MIFEYFPLNAPLLINGSYPWLICVSKKSFKEHHEKQKTATVKKKIRKFYEKRHFLFKKFDEGIQLDEESWYSVVPEDMAEYIAQKIFKKLPNAKIIDGFCGSGGLTIQLAKLFQVTAIDLDPVKVQNIKHNLEIYGQQAEVINIDFLLYNHVQDSSSIMVLCPPWGGLNYHKKEFDLETMTPPLSSILQKAFQVTHNLVVQLPRNINLKQLITLFQEAVHEPSRYTLEIEMFYLNNQLSQLFVYYGQLTKVNPSTELEIVARAANTPKCQGVHIIKNLKIPDQFEM